VSIFTRIGEWLIRKLVGAAADEVEERIERRDEPKGTPLSHKDVEHQQSQIRSAARKKPN
jgi:hypothetical protein